MLNFIYTHTEKIKMRILSILEDLWGFIVLLSISILLKGKDYIYSIFNHNFLNGNSKDNKSLFDTLVKDKISLTIKNWTESENMTTSIGFKIAMTTVALTFTISFIISFSLFTLHIIYPKVLKIISHALLPFIVYKFHESLCTETFAGYLIIFSVLISLQGLWNSVYCFDSLAYEISRKHSRNLFKQSFTFYLKIVSQWILILVDVIVIRLTDITNFNVFKLILFNLYTLSFIYSNAYSLRSNLTNYYAYQLLPVVDSFSILDGPYYYFNAKCFSIVKCISLFYTIPTKLISNILNTENFKIFESNQTAMLACSLKKKSFFRYVLSNKEDLWKGEMRTKMKKINLKEDMIASMFICWVILQTVVGVFQKNFIRSYESFLILFTHFSILIEIFNSYIMVLIYKSSYRISSNRLKVDHNITRNQDEYKISIKK